jgi:hypothetical protein
MDFLKNTRRLKSKPLPLTFSESDTEGGILKGVVMAQVGEAKGHGFHLDQGFINDLVAYDELTFSGNGLKARFDHPALCDGTMGSQLGKFTNFRVDGDKALADLQLLDAANDSPTHPKMKNYILKMAAESPDFLMSSIVFQPDAFFQLDSEGKKFQLAKRNAKKEMMGINEPNPDFGNIFAELGDHFYTDIVEAGAATDTLFSSELNSEKLGVRVVEFLNDNEEIKNILQNTPSVVTDFLSKVGVDVVLKSAFVIQQETAQTAQTALSELQTTFDAFVIQKETAFVIQKETADAQIAQLQSEIEELKKQPAANHAGGRTDGEGANPITQEYAALGAVIRRKAR